MSNITFEKFHKISFVLEVAIIFCVALSIGNILVTGECSVLTGVCNGLIAIMWLLYAIYVDNVLNTIRKSVERMR